MVHNTSRTRLNHIIHGHLRSPRMQIKGIPAGTKKATAVASALVVARRVLMRRMLRRFIRTSLAVLLVMGGLQAQANVTGEFVPEKSRWQSPRGFSIPNPESKVVILFLHGSMVEKLDDTCDPNGETIGFSVPEVVKELAGTEVAGLEVVVFALCDGRATNMGEPLKIDQRVEAINRTLQDLRRAGVEPSRIFLVGHSAGGWAALLYQKRHPGNVNSVVAFAPAFSGKKRSRPVIWQQRRERLAAEIFSANFISALVFAFNNDPYNSPDDLEFLARIKGITLRHMPDSAIAGVVCDIPFFGSSHSNAYRECFRDTQSEVLLNFLSQRLLAQREVRAGR